MMQRYVLKASDNVQWPCGYGDRLFSGTINGIFLTIFSSQGKSVPCRSYWIEMNIKILLSMLYLFDCLSFIIIIIIIIIVIIIIIIIIIIVIVITVIKTVKELGIFTYSRNWRLS